MNFYVQYKLIRFVPSNCIEKIYLLKEGHDKTEDEQCSTISNAKDVRNKVITRQIPGSLHIAYQNTGNHPAGVVWVQVEGTILIFFVHVANNQESNIITHVLKSPFQ